MKMSDNLELVMVSPDDVCSHETQLTPDQTAYADRLINLLNKGIDKTHGGPLGTLKVEHEVIK